ncbi:hypothetical protein R1sor_025187 [Riccia sorocarpa]|uniref:Fungal lipase-type domain-containing protein n=1 Tax=Riccia sorocarpa TaxID=122646 RepID=A0ABD3G9W5_9MARC
MNILTCLTDAFSTRRRTHSEPKSLPKVVGTYTMTGGNQNPTSNTVSGYEAPKGNIAKRWRELQGANNWTRLLSPLDLDLRREILRYGNFVHATEDSFPWEKKSRHPWACPLKKSELLSNTSHVVTGYEVTRYLYSHLRGRKDEIQEVNWIGYVAVTVDPEEIKRLGRRDIVVAWRGTVTDIEWEQDAVLSQIQPTSINGNPVPKDVLVSEGFWGAFADFDPAKSVYGINGSAGKQATEEVKRLIEKYSGEQLSITCAGHSLGGALATCCAYEIAEGSINKTPSGTIIPITAFTYASPRVGNVAFRERFKTLGVKVLRIASNQDIVPCLPVGDDDDSNPIIDNVKMDVEQTAKKTPIRDVLGFLVQKLEDAILPDDYTHVGVTLALDFSKSPYLKQPGKWIDLNSVENLHRYHNLEGYLHLVNGIFGGAKGDLKKPFKPVVIRDLAPLNKWIDLLADTYAKNVPENWWKLQRHTGLERNKDGVWEFPEVHGDITKPNPDFD